MSVEEKDKLNIISLSEFLYSHGELAAHDDRANSTEGNAACFINDLLTGTLERYRGTYVAYQKGILCGQSSKRSLYNAASAYYGSSSLSVFRVPDNKIEDEPCVELLQEKLRENTKKSE